MTDKPIFIIWGGGGWPKSFSAASNKFFLMGKALLKEGYRVVLINRFNFGKNSSFEKGSIDGIEYIYLYSGEKTIFKQILTEFTSIFWLRRILNEYKPTHNRRYLMFSYTSLFSMFSYRLLTKVYNYQLLASIMEYHPALAKNIKAQIKAWLFWGVCFKVVDAALVISDFLQNEIKNRNKNLPIHKIPVLGDFNIKKNMVKQKSPYFLYCGSVGYSDIIKLIVSSFEKLKLDNFHLFIVISGKENKVESLKIRLSKHKNIHVFYQLSYQELLNKYANAIGLLIPMRNTVQDIARFPQKIAEYASVGVPIITNPVGEIGNYFEDRVSAVYAERDTIEAYSKAMEWVGLNLQEAKKIGLQGRKVGLKHFHYGSVSQEFNNFLKQLV